MSITDRTTICRKSCCTSIVMVTWLACQLQTGNDDVTVRAKERFLSMGKATKQVGLVFSFLLIMVPIVFANSEVMSRPRLPHLA